MNSSHRYTQSAPMRSYGIEERIAHFDNCNNRNNVFPGEGIARLGAAGPTATCTVDQNPGSASSTFLGSAPLNPSAQHFHPLAVQWEGSNRTLTSRSSYKVMQTVVVRVVGCKNYVRVLLDTGSHESYVTERLVNQIEPKPPIEIGRAHV